MKWSLQQCVSTFPNRRGRRTVSSSTWFYLYMSAVPCGANVGSRVKLDLKYEALPKPKAKPEIFSLKPKTQNLEKRVPNPSSLPCLSGQPCPRKGPRDEGQGSHNSSRAEDENP